tara:strand:- start:74 stop:271 length:198 start_codon:yes stop_codon:yes gene_type:complete
MINVFKAGGPWKLGSFDYTVKVVSQSKARELIKGDWFATLEEAKPAPKKPAIKKAVSNDNEGPNS